MSNLIFKFPTTDDYELEKSSHRVRKSRKRLAIIFLIDVICFFAFAISGLELFIFVVAVLTMLLYLFIRYFLRTADITSLIITAYDDYFKVKKYNYNLKTIEIIELYYEDISQATYDSSCCSICILYNDGKLSKEDFEKNPLPVHKDGVINYNVSMYSWEQFFFLYVLPEKINIKIRNNHRATAKGYIKKKFGKSESYITNYLMSK